MDFAQAQPSQTVKAQVKVNKKILELCGKEVVIPEGYTFGDQAVMWKIDRNTLKRCRKLDAAKAAIIKEMLKAYQ